MMLLSVAIGGALGAVARFLLAVQLQGRIDHQLLGVPASTLLVNLAGSALIGVIYVLLIEKNSVSAELQSFLMVGILGAFTTFSTFSLDSIHLLEAGHYGLAIGYIISSVVLCTGACFVAIHITRMM